MAAFSIPLQVRWSDLDPNFHLRHSVYYDWGALCRIQFLQMSGLDNSLMLKHHFGPIIFREECVFKKEIRFGDGVTIDLQLLKARRDSSRWTFQHFITRNDETAAILTIDGAWIDTKLRKLTIPPAEALPAFESMPKSAEFQWLD